MRTHRSKGNFVDASLLGGFALVCGWLSYGSVQMVKFRHDLNSSTEMALKDGGFRMAMADAGYRVEEHTGRYQFRWIEARCARADDRKPLPCDPAPVPQGLAGKVMTVIP